MKWSWKIARLADIDVYVHATFFILIAWIGLSIWQQQANIPAVINGIGFILILFVCVVLHEFGHALTARRFGIRTRHITLLPIGGVAALERMPDDPKQEFLVALAGPAVNVVIALGLWLWLQLSNGLVKVEEIATTDASFMVRLMAINVMLAVFNLIPALPMDGGRVLRALLAMRLEPARATQIAASVGQILAVWMGVFGFFYYPFLMFIALFVWIGAVAEAGSAHMKSILGGVKAGDATLTDVETLSPDEPLSRAIEMTLAGSQKDFPVLINGVVAGVLTQSALLKGLQADGQRASVRDWMHEDVQSVDKSEPLEKVLERLRESPCKLLPVVDAGRIIGFINIENIAELMQFQQSLHARRAI
jgi:Zn-dependent protease